MSATIYSFPSNETPALSEVGGKGFSLVQMSRFMPVPPGFVLTTKFFEPWWQQLFGSEEWKQFESSTDEDLPRISSQLKSHAMFLNFNDDQNDALAEAISKFDANELFAVRSSSPEEDLEGTSFAGLYETVLGVSRKNIQAAVRTCFASCLDSRILAYKREHGFNLRAPKIAVVIQKQVASEVAGVAFSLNPLTNDFDEAVITANFGLGETVVSGEVIPDTFVVDKLELFIKSRQKGTKEKSIWLVPNGGTSVREGSKVRDGQQVSDADRFCLSDSQVIEVTRLVNSVEARNGRPMDIEWAFEKGKLYLLQARPVTAFQPLPPDLVTMPRRPRRLYLDITRSVQGLEEPLSEMGASVIRMVIASASRKLFQRDLTDHIDRTIAYITAGRVYANVSNALTLTSAENLLNKLSFVDSLAAKALAGVDLQSYKSSDPSLKAVPLMMMRRLPGLVGQYLYARVTPELVQVAAASDVELFKQQLLFLRRTRSKLRDFTQRATNLTIDLALHRLAVCLIAGLSARERLRKICGKQFAEDVELLTKSLPHNVTVEMGLALYALAHELPTDAVDAEPSALQARIRAREMPPEFMLAWDNFIGKYGHRAPLEFDIATPRYREDHKFLVSQLLSLSKLRDSENNPRAKYEKAVRDREAAYERIHRVLATHSRMSVIRFESSYRVMTSLLGYRETPKFCVMLAIDAIRQRIIEAAQVLVSQRLLDNVNQVWDVSFDQLCAAVEGNSIDLRAAASANRARRTRLKLKTLPKIFDSRGRIIRAPVAVQRENEIAGMPISPGSATGIARVLHSPDEKPLQSGDILIARATDPGWTPLFATASAVVLEVGGMLQHGALVAREYGLPCVAGIPNVTELLKDGSKIEVDGTNGIVRILSGER